jgi:hypothetical protein
VALRGAAPTMGAANIDVVHKPMATDASDAVKIMRMPLS